ncbi:MAG: DEAD/DEAH box helicase [Deltaproteobacteria bacterium]|nr:DEAD/DEAH box helicase [Deltaproteobacteria bacterium]
MFQLRDYQKRALDDARSAFRAGKKRSLIVAPTGAGKTVIACAFIQGAQQRGSRTLFLAHRIELIEQTSRKLTDLGIEHGIIKAGIDPARERPEALVQVAAIATLDRRRDSLREFQVVIVDEAHHAKADSWSRVIEATKYKALLGLTATPYRTDGRALGDLFDALIQVSSLAELVEQGHLVEPRVFGRDEPDLSSVKKVGNDYNQGDLGRVMDQPVLIDGIVREWKKLAVGRTTVVFATTKEHSRHIVEAFQREGVRAGHVDGDMPESQRAAVLGRLASGELEVVSNCQILTEGWDLPRCSAVVLARPTQSRSLWKQMCGRALRPCPEVGKQDCFILDHAGCWKRHGFLTDPEKPSLEGREPRQSDAPVFSCRFCGAEFRGRPRYCPECDRELPRREVEDVLLAAESVEDQLVEVGPVRNEREFFHQLLREARSARNEPMAARLAFRRRIGNWPKRELDSREPLLEVGWDTITKRPFWVIPLDSKPIAPVPKVAAQPPAPEGESAIRIGVRNLVACPACSAKRGQNCIQQRGDTRQTNHKERVAAANEVALGASCPECGASARALCVSSYGDRKNAHAGRLNNALAGRR